MEKLASDSPSASNRDRKASIAFFRYALVGIVSNACGYGVYSLFTWMGVSPIVAMSILYSVGAALGYLGNRQWAFSHNGRAWPSLIRYWVAHLLGYGLNLCILYFFVNRMGYSHQLVQAGAVCVVAGFLFLMFNYFVFPKNRVIDPL